MFVLPVGLRSDRDFALGIEGGVEWNDEGGEPVGKRLDAGGRRGEWSGRG